MKSNRNSEALRGRFHSAQIKKLSACRPQSSLIVISLHSECADAIEVKGKVKGSGRGRPLYTNNAFIPPDAGSELSHVRIIIVTPRTDAS